MSTSKPNQHYDILGVRVDALTMAEAAARITDRAADTRQPAAYVVKPYVEFLDSAHPDTHLRQLLNASWLSLPDGVSTQWAAAYLYDGRPSWWRVMALGAGIIFRPRAVTTRIPERFGGTRFTWTLLEAAASRGLSVYLVGSPQGGDISATAAAIHDRLPKLVIVGSWAGQLDGLSGPALLEALRRRPVERDLAADLKAKRPDIILVGMGFPMQEELMAKLAGRLPHGVLIGEGGTFDYNSFGGYRRKAPGVVQAIGLEWLWRLFLEPKRIRRQLAIPRFVWTVYRASKPKA
jgi:N-acetylglucosaminyldiphosphoundecaprenol N-acetyl-beta-D-mannosaminyltransferase